MTVLRLPLLASFGFWIGCATALADSPTPKEIVIGLRTTKANCDNYTKPEQVKKIKGVFTPQLYSALLDWSVWLQKAYKAIPETDYDALMMMPMSNNPFFGESDQQDDSAPAEKITGDTATVVTVTVFTESDGETVLRKTTNAFQFVWVKDHWLVSDVRRVEMSFPNWKPFQYDLLAHLKEETARFKKGRK